MDNNLVLWVSTQITGKLRKFIRVTQLAAIVVVSINMFISQIFRKEIKYG